jgi:hypothetical protein
MNLHPFTALSTNHWVDLPLAADYAGVSVDVLVQAITARQVRASTSHPERPGDWLVPLADLDRCWPDRQSAVIVLR